MESGAGIGSSPTDAPAGADSKASRKDLMVALEQVAVNQQAEVDERLSEVYRMIHNMITVVQEFDRSKSTDIPHTRQEKFEDHKIMMRSRIQQFGRVNGWNKNVRGLSYITPDDGGEDIPFCRSDLTNDLLGGELVSYVTSWNSDEQSWRAVDVQLEPSFEGCTWAEPESWHRAPVSSGGQASA